MKRITNTIKNTYYRFQPGEFMPVYMDGQLLNRREFHKYRIKWIITNYKVFAYQLTHTRG